MATGFRPMATNIILIIFFSLCIITFAYEFVSNANPSSPVLNDAKFNISGAMTSLNGSLSSFSSTIQDAKDAASAAKPSPTSFVFLIFEAAFSIPRMFLGVIGSAFVMFSQILFPFLGAKASIALTLLLGVIVGSLFIAMLFMFIKMVRTGESER